MSELIGGELGRHARVGPPYRTWWTPIRVILAVVGLASVLPILTFSHCVNSGWRSPDMYVHFCYSEVSENFALYSTLSIIALAATTLFLATLTVRWIDALQLPAAPAVLLTLFIGREALAALAIVLALYLVKRADINHIRIARILLVISLLFLILTRSDRPQYVLLIAPLVIISGISRRDFYIWQGIEVIFQIVLWQSLATINGAPQGLPASANDLAIWIHILGSVFLIARLIDLVSVKSEVSEGKRRRK